MSRFWRLMSVATVFGALSGGCPLEPGSGFEAVPGSGSPATSTGEDGPSISPSGGSSGSEVGQTQGTQTFDDWLSGQFPACSEPVSGDQWRAEILRLVNVERVRAGLTPVEHSQTLEDQATQYACEMIQYDFFAHENPVTGTELRDRTEEFEYEYLVIGENLAAGQSTPAQVMADWMSSAGHRENILKPDFTELGVGARTGGRYGTYWVQEFGKPLRP